MTYYVEPSVFYWMNVCATIRFVMIFVFAASLVFLFVCVLLCFIENDLKSDEERAEDRKRVKTVLPVFVISALLLAFIPDKHTCIEMLVAKTVTVENVSNTVEGTKELIDYIFEKVNAK